MTLIVFDNNTVYADNVQFHNACGSPLLPYKRRFETKLAELTVGQRPPLAVVFYGHFDVSMKTGLLYGLVYALSKVWSIIRREGNLDEVRNQHPWLSPITTLIDIKSQHVKDLPLTPAVFFNRDKVTIVELRADASALVTEHCLTRWVQSGYEQTVDSLWEIGLEMPDIYRRVSKTTFSVGLLSQEVDVSGMKIDDRFDDLIEYIKVFSKFCLGEKAHEMVMADKKQGV